MSSDVEVVAGNGGPALPAAPAPCGRGLARDGISIRASRSLSSATACDPPLLVVVVPLELDLFALACAFAFAPDGAAVVAAAEASS